MFLLLPSFRKLAIGPAHWCAPTNCRATLYKFLIYANEALSHYFTFATRRPTNAIAAPSHSAPAPAPAPPLSSYSFTNPPHQTLSFQLPRRTWNIYIYILCKKRASRSQKMSQCFFHLIFSEQTTTTTTARDTSLLPHPHPMAIAAPNLSVKERERRLRFVPLSTATAAVAAAPKKGFASLASMYKMAACIT